MKKITKKWDNIEEKIIELGKLITAAAYAVDYCSIYNKSTVDTSALFDLILKKKESLYDDAMDFGVMLYSQDKLQTK